MSDCIRFYREDEVKSAQFGEKVYTEVSIPVEDFNAALEHYGFVKERTCRWEYPQNVNGWVGYTVCSSCGEKYDETITDSSHYCPNCGAKVVGE